MPLKISGDAIPVPVLVQELMPAAAQAPAVAPTALKIGEGVAPAPLGVNIQAVPTAGQAPAVGPPPIDVTAELVRQRTPFLGFRLAKIVLAITAGSIITLILYLLIMELVIASDVREAYHDVLRPERVGSEYLLVARLQRLSDDLENNRKNPSAQWSTESLENGQKIVAEMLQLPSLTTAQRAQLQNCVPPPAATDTARDSKIADCLVLLGTLRQATLQAVASGTDAKVAGDSSGRIGDQRENLHKFWMQASQLILLNLLLPLLTALFGYIFGTQQAQQSQKT